MEALYANVDAYLTRNSRLQGLDLCTALGTGLVVAAVKALVGAALGAGEDGGDRR